MSVTVNGGLPRDQVSEVQRARMLAAMVEAVAEVGYAGVSVAQVIERASVSRRTFYELFEDREHCFLAAFDEVTRDFGKIVLRAYEREASWLDGVRAGLATLLGLLEREPATAWFCVVEPWGAGERTLNRCSEVSRALASVLERGREQRGGRDPSPITGEGLVGGATLVLHTRLVQNRKTPLMDLLGPLMSMIALPYLGPAAARRELERSAPRIELGRSGSSKSTDQLLHAVPVRLTYRTLRVLRAIEHEPGSSNNEVALGAGVGDQGQISKLLKRLEELELVENRGDGAERGAPNAWRLTFAGERVVGSIGLWREVH